MNVEIITLLPALRKLGVSWGCSFLVVRIREKIFEPGGVAFFADEF